MAPYTINPLAHTLRAPPTRPRLRASNPYRLTSRTLLRHTYILRTTPPFRSVLHALPLQIMVYGEYGRTGLYDLQQLLRDLHGAIDRNRPPGRAQMRSAKKIAMARLLLEHLPKTHRLRTDTWRWESLKASLDATGDVGVVDTLLPAVDHAFTVKDVTAMVEKAELELVTFIQPAAYRPET